MRKWLLTLTVLAAATLLTAAARAQSGGGYDLSWWTIDGGGITFAAGGACVSEVVCGVGGVLALWLGFRGVVGVV